MNETTDPVYALAKAALDYVEVIGRTKFNIDDAGEALKVLKLAAFEYVESEAILAEQRALNERHSKANG
jgi:hypothetical protein